MEKSESRKKRYIKFIFCFTTDKGRVEKMFIFFVGKLMYVEDLNVS